MAEGAEYPKALYRDGGAELLWGMPIETCAAADADEEAELAAKGWRLHPLAPEAPEKRRTVKKEPAHVRA